MDAAAERNAGRFGIPTGWQPMAINQNIHDIMANEHKVVTSETPIDYTVEHTFLCIARHQSVDTTAHRIRAFNYCPFCGREVNANV